MINHRNFAPPPWNYMRLGKWPFLVGWVCTLWMLSFRIGFSLLKDDFLLRRRTNVWGGYLESDFLSSASCVRKWKKWTKAWGPEKTFLTNMRCVGHIREFLRPKDNYPSNTLHSVILWRGIRLRVNLSISFYHRILFISTRLVRRNSHVHDTCCIARISSSVNPGIPMVSHIRKYRGCRIHTIKPWCMNDVLCLTYYSPTGHVGETTEMSGEE